MEKIKIQGMSCQHCVMSVSRALSQIPGLKDVQVNLVNGEATFENVKSVSRETIRKAVEEAGYRLAG
jgi:copper chaperone